jgi:hypothetical protein
MLINKRCRLPWDLDRFKNIFKNENKKKEYKIYHSANRIKNIYNDKEISFTTPRK